MTPLALATLAVVGFLSDFVDTIVGARSAMAAKLISAPRGLRRRRGGSRWAVDAGGPKSI